MLLNDPKLPHLVTAMDTSAMAENFTGYLRALCPELVWEVAQCAIEKVYYQPTEHCGLLYRLTFCHPTGMEADEWFYGRMYPPGCGYNRFERAVSKVKHLHAAHDFLRGIQPVNFWHDLSMILWVFPQDPKMATLPQVVDLTFVRQQVETNLRVFSVFGNESDSAPEAWRCADICYDRVKYMPGKRCVLRYHADLVSPAGESQEVSFYSKTYSDASSRYHFEFLRSVYEQLTAQTMTVHIPQPLLHLDGFNTFWQEEWKGKPLTEVMNEFDWNELFPRIATALAAWHQSRITGLSPGPDPDEVLKTADEDGAQLAYFLPHYQHLAKTVLERLNVVRGTFEGQIIPTAPSHGAFRLEQILVRGTELALVDFDAVALGDPLYDVAEFIASLQYLEFSTGKPRERLVEASEAFYNSYAEQVPWSCDRRRAAWYVVAFLMSKMFSSVKHRNVEALQRIESAGQEIVNSWLEFIK
jgi:thiamine kinase-like enzyme